MKPTLLNRLDQLVDRYEELAVLLSDPEVIRNQTQFVAFSQEYSDLEPVVELVRRRRELIKDLSDLDGLLSSDDDEDMSSSNSSNITNRVINVKNYLERYLLPSVNLVPISSLTACTSLTRRASIISARLIVS